MELPSIFTSTLVIAVNKDRLTKPVASVHMVDMKPNAQIALYRTRGHQGLIERHSEVKWRVI